MPMLQVGIVVSEVIRQREAFAKATDRTCFRLPAEEQAALLERMLEKSTK